jgi:hypothetical protein
MRCVHNVLNFSECLICNPPAYAAQAKRIKELEAEVNALKSSMKSWEVATEIAIRSSDERDWNGLQVKLAEAKAVIKLYADDTNFISERHARAWLEKWGRNE